MTKTSQQGTGQRTADALFLALQEKIIAGTLKNGEPLPAERELVQKFGVSRTVVREAIGALSNRGLIEARRGFRPIVRRPSYETAFQAVESVAKMLLTDQEGVKNLFELRIMMEASLVRNAAIHANRDQIAELKAALDANGAALLTSEDFYKTDMQFHRMLYVIGGNPVLPSLHRAYTAWLAPQWEQMPRKPDRNDQNFAAHRKIFDCILMRDPDAAEAALRSHLAFAWDQVRETFFATQEG